MRVALARRGHTSRLLGLPNLGPRLFRNGARDRVRDAGRSRHRAKVGHGPLHEREPMVAQRCANAECGACSTTTWATPTELEAGLGWSAPQTRQTCVGIDQLGAMSCKCSPISERVRRGWMEHAMVCTWGQPRLWNAYLLGVDVVNVALSVAAMVRTVWGGGAVRGHHKRLRSNTKSDAHMFGTPI